MAERVCRFLQIQVVENAEITMRARCVRIELEGTLVIPFGISEFTQLPLDHAQLACRGCAQRVSLECGQQGALGLLPTARPRQQNAAVYAQDNIALNDSTKLTLGARQHYMRVSAHDRMNAAAYAKGAKTSFPRAWDVALRHELSRSTALFGRVGSSFRIATVDEIYSQFGSPSGDAIVTVLDPQTAFNQELGLEYRAGKFHARANAFLMQLNNEIHFFSLTFSNINLPPTEHKGMEFDASFDVTPNLTLTGNLSMTDARFRNGLIGTRDVSGKTIPLVPRELANLGLAWKIADALQFSAAWRHVGVQYFDNDQTNTFPSRVPSYSTTDIKLTHKSGPATVALGMTNVLDRRYYSYAIRNGAGTSFNAYPERPRAIMLSMQYDLP